MANEVCSECGKEIVRVSVYGSDDSYWYHLSRTTGDCRASGHPQPLRLLGREYQHDLDCRFNGSSQVCRRGESLQCDCLPLSTSPTLTADPLTFPCHDCGAAVSASCVDIVGHTMQGYHYSRLNQARLAIEANGGSK